MTRQIKEVAVSDLTWHNEKRKVCDLIPYEHNPRTISEEQMEYLKNSLKSYNLVDVPILDADDTLIGGHQRARALSILGRGDEEIDVRVPNRKLTPLEFKNLNIELNRLRGKYDFELLGNLFDEEELLDLGFSERELDDVTFPELDNAEFSEDVDIGEQKKYELIFASIDDYKKFAGYVKDIQNNYFPESSMSDSLLKYIEKNES